MSKTVYDKDMETKILLEKFNKEELAEQLAFYKKLERKGNVYYEYLPSGHCSLRMLIEMACIKDHTKEEINSLLIMKFKKVLVTKKNSVKQTRCVANYNRHSNMLRLSGLLSVLYKRQHNGKSCPRIKNEHLSKTTEELLDCRSGSHNCYPISYLGNVKNYMKFHPLKEWHLEHLKTETIIDGYDKITYTNGEVKYKCTNCSVILKAASRKAHTKTKTCINFKK
jgi:hypothetical protein